MKFSKGSKLNDIQWDLKDKNFICTSQEWIKWAKKYTSRANRRKQKQELRKERYDDD